MSRSPAPLSVALIGCGDIAETGHVPSLLAHPDVRIACVCDLRRDRAEHLAALAGGVPAETDYREAIARHHVDAVVLALHPEASVDAAIHCLRAGLPVLDEKPLAINMAAGERLAAVVAETGGTYQIGFVFHYSEFVRQTAWFCDQIGTPRTVHLSIYDEAFESTETAHYAKIAGILRHSSAAVHEGSHVFDYMGEWMAAAPTSVAASARATDPRFPGPNLWSIAIDFADQSLLDLQIGWLLPDLPASTLRAVGPRGWVAFDVFTGQGEAMIDRTPMAVNQTPLRQNWQRQLDAFVAAIRDRRRPAIGIDAGFRALRISLACDTSARTGAPVPL